GSIAAPLLRGFLLPDRVAQVLHALVPRGSSSLGEDGLPGAPRPVAPDVPERTLRLLRRGGPVDPSGPVPQLLQAIGADRQDDGRERDDEQRGRGSSNEPSNMRGRPRGRRGRRSASAEIWTEGDLHERLAGRFVLVMADAFCPSGSGAPYGAPQYPAGRAAGERCALRSVDAMAGIPKPTASEAD